MAVGLTAEESFRYILWSGMLDLTASYLPTHLSETCHHLANSDALPIELRLKA